MTEQLNTGTAPAVESNSIPTPAVTTEYVAPAEKMVTIAQSRLDNIAEDAYKRGHAKGEAKVANAAVQQPQATTQVGMTTDDLERMVREQTQAQLAEMHRLNQVQAHNEWSSQQANTFVQKMNEGQGKYADYETVIAPIAEDIRNPQSPMAHLIPFMNQLDNVSDVLYELGKNRQKSANLISLLQAPAQLRAGLHELSSSIKANQVALNQKVPNQPLSQVSPSNTGVDNGSKNASVKDLRADPRYRS